MNRLEQARSIVRTYQLPQALRELGADDVGDYADEQARLMYYDGSCTRFLRTELTPEVLAASLHYRIGVRGRPVRDEAAVPLGASKLHGLPHLPPGFAWPAQQYFVAQFNLAELRPMDVLGALPERGMLYLFFDCGHQCTAIHYDGPLDGLQITPYPAGDQLPDAEHYLRRYRDRPARIAFEPGCRFYIDGPDRPRLPDLIPIEWAQQVSDAVGFPLLSRDPDHLIFGRPLFWQGEDEDPFGWDDLDDEADETDGDADSGTDDEADGDGATGGVDGDGDGDSDAGTADGEQPRIMLFQEEFGEGHVHFWVDPTETRAGDFSGCWNDYSGT